jgi:hypothetical protein
MHVTGAVIGGARKHVAPKKFRNVTSREIRCDISQLLCNIYLKENFRDVFKEMDQADITIY